MHPSPRQIHPLPVRTASHLRSSVVLPSLPSILTELIQNALDANSTKIDLSFDLTRWTLVCHDNGHGISWADLDQLGREKYLSSKLGGGVATRHGKATNAGAPAGERHGEIRLGEVGTFGFRGEAMASMADVGLVEVLTRPLNEGGSSYELLVSGGKTVSLAKAGKERVGIGTSVWVRDIFENYPVRRRPLSTATARPALVAALRKAVTTLALVHPRVSFSLADNGGDDVPRLLSVARSSEGVLGRWRQMWGRAGVEKVASLDDEEVSGEMSVHGFFSLTASHSKGSQYIYVNSRPLGPSHLHKLVNSAFASSAFARHASSHLVAPTSPTPSQQRGQVPFQPAEADSATPHRFRATPKKVTERHPIFVLMLDLPAHLIDVTLEPEKRTVEFVDEERVMGFVEEAVRGWLREQGFVTEGASGSRREESLALAWARETLSDEELTHVKRAREGLAKYLSPHGPLSPRPRTPVRVPHLGLGAVSSTPVQTRPNEHHALVTPVSTQVSLVRPPSRRLEEEIVIDGDATEPVRWVDPTTGDTVMIDSRSGNSWRVGDRLGGLTQVASQNGVDTAWSTPAGVRRMRADRSRLRTRMGDESDELKPLPEWMATALEDWSDPVFPSAPAPVPALVTIELDDRHRSDHDRSPPPGFPPWLVNAGISRSRSKEMDAFFRNSTRVDAHHLLGEGGSQRVTKAGLAKARFIAQVDRKFLLVAIPAEDDTKQDTPASGSNDQSAQGWPGDVLVMVDQHAADERVRVERIWEGVAGRVARGEEVEREALEPPLGVIVSREEAELLGDVGKRAQFGRWGVDLSLSLEPDGTPTPTQEQDYAQIWLTAVPKVVAGRLKLEPKLRQELVRSFVGAEYAVGDGAGPSAGGVSGGEPTAAAALRDCPPVLVELMNSLACRGAVMFNDGLSRRQCEALLRKLAQTQFPFQCAHGRPTLQPVVNLPGRRKAGEVAVRTGAGGLDWSALLRDEGPGSAGTS